MEIGNFSKCALLTGAGWSHNWGARLASGVWQLVMDNSKVAANDRLRTLLLGEPSFELALAKTQVFPFTTEDREQFGRALVDAFVSMDRAMTRPFDGSPGTINIYKVQELLFRFAGQRGENFDTGYYFTLNQDLFPERSLYNQHVYGAPAPSLPGVEPTPGLSLFTTNIGSYSEQFIMRPVADPAGSARLRARPGTRVRPTRRPNPRRGSASAASGATGCCACLRERRRPVLGPEERPRSQDAVYSA